MDYLWEEITPPLSGRLHKPRAAGMTMLIDKGLSLTETAALLEQTASFIDFIKLSFGTAALYQTAILKQKIRLAAAKEVIVYPGGTFLEIAFWRNKLSSCLKILQEYDFQWVEISDGTLEISEKQRLAMISAALSAGFKVIAEVGKKDPEVKLDDNRLIETALRDLEAGADRVIIEARESGKGIGIYDAQGAVIAAKLNLINEKIPPDKIIWEAPLKNQQAALINQFGPNVNLGNIPPAEALALEALRLGYRSDTWKKCLEIKKAE